MRPHKVLSVRQPWAELIIAGTKDIENRTWATAYRGPLLIHAGSFRPDDAMVAQFDPAALTYGAVIGHVDLIDVVEAYPSSFFFGPYGWVLSGAQRIDPPIRLRGRLGLFNATQAQLRIPVLEESR